jgi:hypothetical protein
MRDREGIACGACVAWREWGNRRIGFLRDKDPQGAGRLDEGSGRGLRWGNRRNLGVGTGPESGSWRSTSHGERLGLPGGLCRLRGRENNRKAFAAHPASDTGRFPPREWGRVETEICFAAGALQDHDEITLLAYPLHPYQLMVSTVSTKWNTLASEVCPRRVYKSAKQAGHHGASV